jgi:lantibiotic leader peptide-processing serine protease
MVTYLRRLTAAAAAFAALAIVGGAVAQKPSAVAGQKYIVVLKQSKSDQGILAIQRAGGIVLSMNKLGIATVSSTKSSFAQTLRSSGAVSGVARDAWFRGPGKSATRFTARATVIETVPAAQAACATLYSVSPTIGPDPLGACQWDMRAINATAAGSYAVNQGAGTRIGDIDTGIDFTHPDLAPNIDVAASCSFIYATTPTSNPAERVTRGPHQCDNKPAVQDLGGHGTHTAGTIAAPMNGIGITGVAPRAKIVALKAGTEQGYFFTDSVVDALVYAGDQRLDAVNMSFFADPWLFNCRKDSDQKAIIQAISRAAAYAQQRGVVLVAAAGNDGIDANHPTTDEISPDYPPGAAVTRDVNNSCVVMPTDVAGVVVVSATGAENLLAWYSSYGTADVTAPGGSRYQTPTFDGSRGRVLSTYSHTAVDLATQISIDRAVEGPAGAYYVWANGTSMAAPHATGVVALIRSVHPGMSPQAVAALLKRTATPMSCPAELDPGVEFFDAPVQYCTGGVGNNSFYGKGLINALLAAQS